jgi:spermidine synthase
MSELVLDSPASEAVPLRFEEFVVSAAFLVSGAVGLVFEVVWIHRCGLVFGNSVWSTSAVLSSLMAGLALGNACAGAFPRYFSGLRAYAWLEVAVAVTGVGLTYLLPQITGLLIPLIRPLGEAPWLVNAIRFGVAFSVMVLPATAMGATLPVLVGGVAHLRGRVFGTVLGRFYGWNTLGAVLGVVGAETVLIPTVGILGSAWAAAGADLVAAALALWMSRRIDRHGPHPDRMVRSRILISRIPWRILACAFVAGGELMALEVVWFRFLSMFVTSSTLTISLMLAVVLTAIGLGGLVSAVWVRRNRHATAYLPLVAVGAACTVTVSYLVFRFATAGSLVAEWYRVLWFSVVLSFASAFLSGVLFTLLGTAVAQHTGDETRSAAWLTLANTMGGMCGPLVATFVLLPALGMERAFCAIAVVYCVIGGLMFREAQARGPVGFRRTMVVTAAGAVIAVVGFPFGLMSRAYFPRAAQPYTADGSRVVATREGPYETIFLMEQSWLGQPIYRRLVTNGFSMSGTHLSGSRYMRAFVYWPMLLHRGPLRNALVVCYGVGVTAGAVTDLASVESIDVVELSRDIVAMSDLIYESGRQPLRDPRVRLHIADGRQFLQTSEQRFDLITGEPPPPLTPGTVNLYTREYFQLIYNRLAEGGISTYWLPVPQRGEYSVAPIIRAFCDVFADCSLWNGTPFDWMLVGTRGAAGPISEARFSKPWSDPRIGPHLREIGFEAPEQIGATFLGDASYLNNLTRDAPPLTDDYPRRLVSTLPPASHVAAGTIIDEVGGSFAEILDPARAQLAFESSPLVRRLWPPALIAKSVPFFALQRVINRIIVEGAKPLGHIAELNALLTETDLRRLPLWALGSNDVLQRIAATGNDGSGMVEFAQGSRLLVARNYGAAASYLREAQRLGFRPDSARPLEVYALCLAGNFEAARARAPATLPADPQERVFWTWIGSHFGVGPHV